MPTANGATIKYAYGDHDTAIVYAAPPTQNNWETLFDEEDVRLIWCVVCATDLLAAGSDIEVRWTIDGTEYFVDFTADSGTVYFIYRDFVPSGGGTAGLTKTDSEYNAAKYVDKRGQSFKVEVRKTSAVLPTDILEAWAVFETLEVT